MYQTIQRYIPKDSHLYTRPDVTIEAIVLNPISKSVLAQWDKVSVTRSFIVSYAFIVKDWQS
jgi:hypothetical protein